MGLEKRKTAGRPWLKAGITTGLSLRPWQSLRRRGTLVPHRLTHPPSFFTLLACNEITNRIRHRLHLNQLGQESLSRAAAASEDGEGRWRIS